MTDKSHEAIADIREKRDLARRLRRIAGTVPAPWVNDTISEYAAEVEEEVAALEKVATRR